MTTTDIEEQPSPEGLQKTDSEEKEENTDEELK